MKLEKQVQQQRRPLFCALQDHLQQEKVSFHVPGHKSGMNWAENSFMKQALKMDQTEVTGLDYLHEAEGVLKESQALLSELYGSRQSYYLINGSTVGNLAMILGTVSRGETVLVDRSCHQSVIHALELAEADPLFVTPVYQADKKEAVGWDIHHIHSAFESGKPIKALVLTYPSYNGQAAELKEIIKYAHQQGTVVLVDEAHGAHFTLGAPFPASALELGADVVVQSAHKMLPALTQSGYLHIGERLSEPLHHKIQHYLHMLQSSSPSYLLMQSLEYARYFLSQFTEKDLQQTLAFRDQWIGLFKKSGLEFWQSDDPLKGRLHWPGHDGDQLAAVLEEQGLYPEKNDHETVLLTFPLLKTGTELLKVGHGFHLPKEGPKETIVIEKNIDYPVLSRLEMGYEQQKELSITTVPLIEADGKIAAQNLTPYPPGIPLVLKGQKILEADISSLQESLRRNHRVVGLDENNCVSIFSIGEFS